MKIFALFTQKFWIFLPLLLLNACDTNSSAQIKNQEQERLQQELLARNNWVDSVYQSLSLAERIGQLFMIAAYSGGEKYNEAIIDSLIRNYHIGGLIFMQGTAEAQARQTNHFQSISRLPLLIGMDAEWGLGMRLTGVQDFPRQMMLGAADNYQLVYELGERVASQCKMLGVHINFAPDIDINNNPKNPVINFRSFGESKHKVATLGAAYMRGMQDNGVLACAKHFPGHGDVDADSHYELPLISKSKEQLRETELYPFQRLADSGVASVMVAHLEIPALDSTKNLPSTLSYNIIQKLLREEMKYEGLIITDALNMVGLTKYYKAGEADLKALMAGNDILLFSENVPLAVKKIEEALNDSTLSASRLESAVKRILLAKYQAGLHHYQPISDTLHLTQKLNVGIDSFRRKVQREAIAWLTHEDNNNWTLQADQKIAYWPVGNQSESFLKALRKTVPNLEVVSSYSNLNAYDMVIVGVHQIAWYPGKNGRYGLGASAIAQINMLAQREKTVFVFFGNAYAAQVASGASNILVTFEEDEAAHEAAADVLNGSLQAKGVVPVTVF